jgi:hypothetical protein
MHLSISHGAFIHLELVSTQASAEHTSLKKYFQVGQMYLTNLPIQSAMFVKTKAKDPGEIWLAIDTFILNLRVWNRTSQLYMMEQQPNKNIK